MRKEHYDPFKEEKSGIFGRHQQAKQETDDAPEMEEQPTETGKLEETIHFHRQEEENTEDTSPRRNIRPTMPGKQAISSIVAAGFWIRFVAFIIDLIVAKAFSSMIATPMIAIAGWPEGLFPAAAKGLFFYLYFVLATYFTNGQTLGKIITGIRVIHPNEERLSLITVLVREGAARLIQTTFIILYLIVPFTERKQSIGDFLADTYVVKEDLYMMEKEDRDIFYAFTA